MRLLSWLLKTKNTSEAVLWSKLFSSMTGSGGVALMRVRSSSCSSRRALPDCGLRCGLLPKKRQYPAERELKSPETEEDRFPADSGEEEGASRIGGSGENAAPIAPQMPSRRAGGRKK